MFVKKGKINDNLQPIIELELANGSKIECLLDTGFNATLILPRLFVEENSMLLVGQDFLIAAEDQYLEIETALAEVNWLGDKFSIKLFISETGDALIGAEMLIDTILEIDYINSTVKITKPK